MAPVIAAILLALAGLVVALVALRRVGPALPPPTDEERNQAREDLARMRGERP